MKSYPNTAYPNTQAIRTHTVEREGRAGTYGGYLADAVYALPLLAALALGGTFFCALSLAMVTPLAVAVSFSALLGMALAALLFVAVGAALLNEWRARALADSETAQDAKVRRKVTVYNVYGDHNAVGAHPTVTEPTINVGSIHTINGIPAPRFGRILDAMIQQGSVSRREIAPMVVDGEVVGEDSWGRVFGALQARNQLTKNRNRYALLDSRNVKGAFNL